MTLTAVVLLAAFVVVYIATYTRTQQEIDTKLDQNQFHTLTLSTDDFWAGSTGSAEATVIEDIAAVEGNVDAEAAEVIGVTIQTMSPDSGMSFNVVVDAKGNLVEVYSALDLPEESYEQATAQAWSDPDSSTPLSMEGRRWRYVVTPLTVEYVTAASFYVNVSVQQYQITFLDVTDDYATLTWLLITLAGSFLLLMVILYFITRHFANKAILPLIEAWDKQNQFIADASHELKTPLSIIHANCDVLYANREESVESQLKWIDRIVQGSDRMSGLVGDMLTLAQMEDTDTQLHPASFDAGELAENALLSMEAAALEKKIEISQDIEPDAILRSDKESLWQVLIILLDNAIKYTPKGGSISLSLHREGRSVLCQVINSGEGIPKEDLPKLFDRFYRGDPARTSENAGHGLGLAIAKATLDKLGGSIWAESTPGTSTTFTISLPDMKQK